VGYLTDLKIGANHLVVSSPLATVLTSFLKISLYFPQTSKIVPSASCIEIVPFFKSQNVNSYFLAHEAGLRGGKERKQGNPLFLIKQASSNISCALPNSPIFMHSSPSAFLVRATWGEATPSARIFMPSAARCLSAAAANSPLLSRMSALLFRPAAWNMAGLLMVSIFLMWCIIWIWMAGRLKGVLRLEGGQREPGMLIFFQ